MLSNYYHYYSCPRLLVLLSLLLLLQPQTSIVTYSYWIFIVITILSTISQLPLLLLLYILLLLLYLLFTILFVTCHHIYHRQKRKTLLYIFERHELFLQFFILYSPLTFYSVMRCLLPLPSTHSATGNFLMGAETTDILLQKKRNIR